MQSIEFKYKMTKIPIGKKQPARIIRTVDLDSEGNEIPSTEEFWVVEGYAKIKVLKRGFKSFVEALDWLLSNGYHYSPR